MNTSPKRLKYFSSILLRFRSIDRFLYRFADRAEAMNPPPHLIDRVRGCMIYLICSRPIITLSPSAIVRVQDGLQFDVQVNLSGEIRVCTVTAPHGLVVDFGGVLKVSEYPHKEIHSYDPDGNLIATTLISNCVHLLGGLSPEASRHQVLYVGKGTSDCAVDRLDGHSPLEQILADILKNEPGTEVALMLYNFKMTKDALSIPEIGQEAKVRGDAAKDHFAKILEYKPSLDEQTRIAEALLIDYFRTSEYNKHFTAGLSEEQDTLRALYDLDFDAVVVELDNENIGCLKLYSQVVEPHYYHHALLDIRKAKGDLSLFDVDSIRQQLLKHA